MTAALRRARVALAATVALTIAAAVGVAPTAASPLAAAGRTEVGGSGSTPVGGSDPAEGGALAAAQASSPFTAVGPVRLADTRPGFATVDGQLAGSGAATELTVPVVGRAGVAADATAVTVNVTATEGSDTGFVTVYPCGEARPFASNLNFAAGLSVPNLVTARLGGGAICLFATSAVHLIVDLAGWYGPTSPLNAVTPARLADTRPAAFTVDGLAAGGGPQQVLEVPVTGRGGVGAGAVAVFANVTVTEPAAAGYVTVYPCGEAFPLASNLNFTAGQTVPNLVLARVGAGGRICLYSSAPAQLVVDVAAWVGPGGGLSAVNPARLLDTRHPGGATVDGRQAGGGKVRGGVYVDLPVTGRASVPAATAAVLLNVTVTEPEAGGYVTAFPCGQARPNASNLNMAAGQTVPNLVLAPVGADGTVCLYTTGRAHLVADLAGWLPASAAPPAGAGPTMLAGCPVFPASNAWNTDISGAPVRAESAGWVGAVSAFGASHLHADFGSNPDYGIPFTVVGPDEPPRPVRFVDYPDESDPGPYPMPLDAPLEGGSDRHAIALQQDTCRLYELFGAAPAGDGWAASNGASFDLRSNALRPDTWTSADAAGLAILAGLARYEEVRSGVITHALRFTVPRTQRGFIHPATHFAGSTTSAPPMGARFRLKSSFDLSGYHGDARVILEALRRYGMIVADNGTGWYISGATDPRWNDEDLDQLKSVPGSAFEVVDTGPVITS